MIRKCILIFISTFVLQSAEAQTRVLFGRMSIEAAVSIGKQKNKPVFIDAFAPWCIPCKRMAETTFRDPRVIRFLNENFVNVKINMDESKNSIYKAKYGVVFLPTMLFMDKEGFVKIKTDRVLNADEFLALAHKAKEKTIVRKANELSNVPPDMNKPPQFLQEQIGQTTSTRPKKSNKNIESISSSNDLKVIDKSQPKKVKDKILYVSGEDDMPPEVLFQEAYFRMELMDGSHWEVARSYLETQQDWGTEKNMRFIFDFLSDTDSKEFKYFVANKSLFEALIGVNQVLITTDILVNTKLNQGFPRPTFEEASYLLSLVDENTSEIKAHKYIIPRYFEEERFDDFEQKCDYYLNSLAVVDAKIMHLYAQYFLLNYVNTPKLKNGIKWADKAFSLKPNNYIYAATLARLQYESGNKKEALIAANKCRDLAKRQSANTKNINELLVLIKQL